MPPSQCSQPKSYLKISFSKSGNIFIGPEIRIWTPFGGHYTAYPIIGNILLESNRESMCWDNVLKQFILNVLVWIKGNIQRITLFVFFETKRVWAGRGREGEGDRESQVGSMLPAQSPIRGSNAWTMRSWPEPKARVGRLTNWPTRVPLHYLIWN